MRILFLVLASITILFISSCGQGPGKNPAKSMYLNCGRVKTLDPALAADLASRNMVAAFYDTLLQYDYTARPYKLIPSMLKSMPELNKAKTVYTFRLRNDLYFSENSLDASMPFS